MGEWGTLRGWLLVGGERKLRIFSSKTGDVRRRIGGLIIAGDRPIALVAGVAAKVGYCVVSTAKGLATSSWHALGVTLRAVFSSGTVPDDRSLLRGISRPPVRVRFCGNRGAPLAAFHCNAATTSMLQSWRL